MCKNGIKITNVREYVAHPGANHKKSGANLGSLSSSLLGDVCVCECVCVCELAIS